jgi:hypothetical protein
MRFSLVDLRSGTTLQYPEQWHLPLLPMLPPPLPQLPMLPRIPADHCSAPTFTSLCL